MPRLCRLEATRALWMMADAILLLLAGVVVYHALTSTGSDTPDARRYPSPLALGSRLRLPGVEWNDATTHVLLRVSSTCDACKASLEFFREATKSARDHLGGKVTVVVAEPEESIRAWLAVNELTVDRVVRLEEPPLHGFIMIPTSLILDSQGLVTDVVIGKPSRDSGRQFLKRVTERIGTTPVDNTAYAEEADEGDLPGLLARAGSVLLDIRTRKAFASRHATGAISIPREELNVRAAPELGAAKRVVVDCRDNSIIACRVVARDLKQKLTARVFIVLRQ